MSSLSSDIEDVFSAVVSAFNKIGQTIGQIPSSVTSSVTNFFGQLGAAIYGAFAAFGTLLKNAWDDFVNALNTIGQWFYDAFKDIASFFKNLWSDLIIFLTWLGKEIWDALVKFFGWVVNAFDAIAHYIVQHLNTAFNSLDAALYGMWCNFRNKLYDIITANVTEVMVYKSIESAAEGKIPLRGLRDWFSLGFRVLGAPVLGSVAASIIGSVLPACGSRTKSFVGQLVVPTLSVSGAAAATAVSVPPTVSTGVGTQEFTPSLTVSYGFTYTVGQLPSVSESYTVRYLVTVQTNTVTMYFPFRISVTVGLSSYASVVLQYQTPVSGAVSLGASLTYTTYYGVLASGSVSLGVSVSYSPYGPVISTNTLTQDISVSYTVGNYASASGSTSLGVSLTYAAYFGSLVQGSTSLGVSVSYSVAAPASALGSAELSVSLTYSIVSPSLVETVSASVGVDVSGQAVDPATFALSLPTPVALAYLYNIGPTPVAQALMSIVARGSPSPALSLIQGLINTYGVDYVQQVLYVAASLYYFSPMITLFTFNQPAISTSGSSYYNFTPPLFASSITGNLSPYACVRCTPVVIANTVAISNYIASAFTATPPGGSPGCNDGGPGAQGIVLIANSITTPATLTANGFANVSPCFGSMGGSASGSPYYNNTSTPSVPLSVYLNYAGGYWWLSSYTPPKPGGGTCCGAGGAYIGGGGAGAGSGGCASGYGGWYFNTSPGNYYVSPGNNLVVATPYLMFSNPQDMAVALMQAVSDLWLMYVLKVTPSSIASMPVVGGGAGGGGADTAGGGGAGSAGEVIVLSYNYQPLTINANGVNALCGSAAVGGGGGAGGYVVVMYPSTSTAPSVSASMNSGSPCTANGAGCSMTPSAGQSGVSIVTPVTWSPPPYITPVTISFS